MTDAELTARLAQVAEAGFRQWRKQKGLAGHFTPTPHRLIDEIVAGLAPVQRELTLEAVAVLLPKLLEEAVDARLTELGFDLDVWEAS